MVGSSARISPKGGYIDRRDIDEADDEDDDEGFYAGLGFPVAPAPADIGPADTTIATAAGVSVGGASRGSRVILAGKRAIEVNEGEEDEGLGLRKRVRMALQAVKGGNSGDEEEEERKSNDDEGGEEMDVDHGSGSGEEEEELEVPTALGRGNPRRRFYFEDAYSSGDDSDDGGIEPEEEPTALLTLRRQKEALNTIRRLKLAATKDPSIIVPEKKPRGKAAPLINEPYRELLNETIKDARTRTVYPDEQFFASEVSGVFWSAGEKTRFFRALPRIGGYNAVGLAEEVRTKSAVEVQGYLDVLKRELEGRLMAHQRTRFELLLGEDIPAAVEVSEECERALDEEAERMRGYIQKLEEKENKEKWGGGGEAVNMEMAMEAEAEAKEGGDDSENDGLFDLVTWLKLSERIFMASVYDENLGRSAIHRQTLEDLKTLVTSVTRRVIQIILFQANSRVRMLESVKYHPPLREVMPKDVLAALKMLGMPITSEEYWRRLPRKLGLRVIRDSEAKRGEAPVSLEYDVVEEELKVFEDIGFYTDSIGKVGSRLQRVHGDEGWETDEEDEVNYAKEDPEEEEWSDSQDSDDDNEEERDDGDDGDGGENDSEQEETELSRGKKLANFRDTPIHLESFLHARPARALKPRQKKDIFDELHYINKDEKYLNAVDKLHSKLEEKRLWKILGGWKDRKATIEDEIRDAGRNIPEEPNLRVFRRLERWRRDDWRKEAGEMVPIWQQEYYRKLLDQERAVRVNRGDRVRNRGPSKDNTESVSKYNGEHNEETGHFLEADISSSDEEEDEDEELSD